MSKKLQKQIAKKLDQLQELIDKIDDVRSINSDDPKTWDPKESPKEKDDFGNPLILEEGLCSLVDSYQNEEEDDYD